MLKAAADTLPYVQLPILSNEGHKGTSTLLSKETISAQARDKATSNPRNSLKVLHLISECCISLRVFQQAHMCQQKIFTRNQNTSRLAPSLVHRDSHYDLPERETNYNKPYYTSGHRSKNLTCTTLPCKCRLILAAHTVGKPIMPSCMHPCMFRQVYQDQKLTISSQVHTTAKKSSKTLLTFPFYAGIWKDQVLHSTACTIPPPWCHYPLLVHLMKKLITTLPH